MCSGAEAWAQVLRALRGEVREGASSKRPLLGGGERACGVEEMGCAVVGHMAAEMGRQWSAPTASAESRRKALG